MAHEGKDKVEDPHFPGEIELYGRPGIATFDAKVPKFLIFNYIFWPIWGIVTLYYFCNGSVGGWLDPGHWHELQIAANTTFPIENQNMLPENQQLEERKPSTQ